MNETTLELSVTKSEDEVLRALNNNTHGNIKRGHMLTEQEVIAQKIGKTQAHVSQTIKSLQKKRILDVTKVHGRQRARLYLPIKFR